MVKKTININVLENGENKKLNSLPKWMKKKRNKLKNGERKQRKTWMTGMSVAMNSLEKQKPATGKESYTENDLLPVASWRGGGGGGWGAEKCL